MYSYHFISSGETPPERAPQAPLIYHVLYKYIHTYNTRPVQYGVGGDYFLKLIWDWEDKDYKIGMKLKF